MIKINKDLNKNIVKFPKKLNNVDREVEAIVFAALEPLDIDTIESKISKKINVLKTLEKLQTEYSTRGINLVCISNKWSFRTSENLSNLMSQEKTVEKKLSQFTKSKYVVSVGSGTEALFISLLSLNLKEDDEVILPSFSWLSVIEVVLLLKLKQHK